MWALSFGSSSFLLLLLCPGGETEAGNGVAVAWGCFFTPCFSCRICHWALLKLLSRLFLSVQLHRGQLEMVLRAASTVGTRCSRARCCAVPPARRALSPAPPLQPHVPLVFLSTHKSQLDGPLLSFVLFSQGLGVPRVTVGARVSPFPLQIPAPPPGRDFPAFKDGADTE